MHAGDSQPRGNNRVQSRGQPEHSIRELEDFDIHKIVYSIYSQIGHHRVKQTIGFDVGRQPVFGLGSFEYGGVGTGPTVDGVIDVN